MDMSFEEALVALTFEDVNTLTLRSPVLCGTKNLHQKSGLAVKADHVLKLYFDPELNHVQGSVQTSMRDHSYHDGVSVCSEYFELMNIYIAKYIFWG